MTGPERREPRRRSGRGAGGSRGRWVGGAPAFPSLAPAPSHNACFIKIIACFFKIMVGHASPINVPVIDRGSDPCYAAFVHTCKVRRVTLE